jgi:hypothetical protein
LVVIDQHREDRLLVHRVRLQAVRIGHLGFEEQLVNLFVRAEASPPLHQAAKGTATGGARGVLRPAF